MSNPNESSYLLRTSKEDLTKLRDLVFNQSLRIFINRGEVKALLYLTNPTRGKVCCRHR